MSRKTRGQPRVLVVDDEPDLLELLEMTLSRMGLDTSRAESVAEAQRMLDRDPFDLCLTDWNLPDGDGLRVVEYITQRWRRLKPAHSTTSPRRLRSSSCAQSSSRR